jgi:pyruvate,water dikinase
VGGKNASLGELIRELTSEGVRVPGGFVVTADGYSKLVEDIRDDLQKAVANLDKENVEALTKAGHKARSLIVRHGLPHELEQEIRLAYREMESQYGPDVDVAVRSSATAEDLPDASFAGQQESFLNVKGEDAVLDACLHCFASLFTDRAIAYRIDKGFDHMSVRLSIGIQKMVRSDIATSGVIFTLDPESGFRNSILVSASYGLGENVVAGRVDPDEYIVFKPTLETHPRPILRRKMGAKQQRLIYSGHGTRTTKNVQVSTLERDRFCLTDEEVLFLARWAMKIEKHYSTRVKSGTAMDIEWAKDGHDGHFYIVQARPETVHSRRTANTFETYELEQAGDVILTGRAIGQKIGVGRVRIINGVHELDKFEPGEVLVADMTDPDWEPVMKKAAGIITNRGGRTCHAAIVSRELGIPCIVGTESATQLLGNGMAVTLHCAEGSAGYVYGGMLRFKQTELRVDEVPTTKTKILVNVGNPEHAFSLSMLPVDGVGLAREEFIITNEVRVHPLALTRYDELQDASAKKQIDHMVRGYASREEYFVDKLAQGIGMIAAAFYPRPVIVRLSDFKTNEYAGLIGGAQFEPKEENPMIGFRGASRYYNPRYRDGFALECRALLKARAQMGLTNIVIMVPFCRTPEEGKLVVDELASNGLKRGDNGLEVYAMCELPSNVLAMDEFAKIFDGFSIGSNDLTQLTLGLDRDSAIVADLFDERNVAVKRAVEMAIRGARQAGRKIGICGQAPSDYPEFLQFLVESGIDSISLSEDCALKAKAMVANCENANQKVV